MSCFTKLRIGSKIIFHGWKSISVYARVSCHWFLSHIVSIYIINLPVQRFCPPFPRFKYDGVQCASLERYSGKVPFYEWNSTDNPLEPPGKDWGKLKFRFLLCATEIQVTRGKGINQIFSCLTTQQMHKWLCPYYNKVVNTRCYQLISLQSCLSGKNETWIFPGLGVSNGKEIRIAN